MIFDSILDVIGRTPIVRMGTLSANLGINVYAKLESFNPGRSHKARIALGMVLDAERKGRLTRGSGQTIIEPSGGNTGIGLAMVANLLGYRVVLVIPDNYSQEKRKLLELYGVQVVLSDSRLGNNSHGEKAMELQLEHPHYVMLNQQRNSANPETHRRSTAKEILEDFSAQPLDCYVGGIGTGGHITGIGEVLKGGWPSLQVYGVEPEGCSLLRGVHASHEIQGLSIGIVPDVLNLSVLDGMIGVAKAECLEMVRLVMRTESISLGISSAANFVAITKLAPSLREGSHVLTMVYDDVDSYITYFE
ncbi:PLP-dependent cysteine synthase family protein [Pseudomonas chlororaphis]|uniref:PLP-dependent cysteine synthase family protein n=1 Tax=Pseudomonas chlororaphis TaxID=587753 RepID=UPI0023654A87|nr:PLP-dependent cysteine synthase family protein [Pseudomonas chlororaphis]WDH25965.1 PLP-dependent cysteine synthase family protein [Pseudomonas chlororaphis]